MTVQQLKNHGTVLRLSIAKAKPYIIGLFITSIATVLFSLVYNIYAGRVIDQTVEILNIGGTYQDILVPLAIFMGMLIATMIAENARSYFEIVYNNMIDLIMDDYKYHKNLSLDPQTYINPEFTAKRTVLDWNGWKVTEATKNIIGIVASFVPAVLFVIILFSYNWIIGVLTVLSVLPTIYTNIAYGKRVWAIWDDNSSNKIVWGLYRNSLFGNIIEPKIMGFGQYIIDKMLALHRSFLAKVNTNERKRLIAVLVIGILEYAILAGAYFLLFAGIIDRTFTIGDFLIITAALWGVKRELGNFSERYSVLESNANFVDDFINYMNWQPVIVSPKDGIKIERTKPISIEFKDVWFKYPGHDNWIFKNLNLTVSSDEDIALVGKNGAGKTTLVKLLIRMYDPVKGTILINGTPLTQIELDSYYKAIGFLGQDFKTYEFSARENIFLGDITDLEKQSRVADFAKLAHADTMISDLKNGYDTFLTTNLEEGQVLSGGQNQRLAIARVFYREPQLLILDEPTSAIDAIAEEEIFSNIFDFSHKRTVIIISHRFATVKKAKKILVLDQGEIVETGTHSELLRRKGLYAEMFTAQTSQLLAD